jgi:molecular chaperone GrpE
MVRSRPEPEDHKEDNTSAGEGDAAGREDSIEILEVVGMEPDSTSEIDSASSNCTRSDPEAPDNSIPYSSRELYDMLLRKQAEFDNARKRQERDRIESRQRIWMDLLARLLPILDNFHRALGESPSSATASFRQGVALTVQQMKDLLKREGLEEIDAVGQAFDPHLHEAVETQTVGGLEEGIVLEDLRKGYRFQGQLLRPTLVRVSSKGGKPNEGPASR